MNSHLIIALDTPDLASAEETVSRLSGIAFAFKIGHALVLGHGLDVVDKLHSAGAQRIFLDMKFHDIPNAVALGVHEATRRGVWMMTLHASGGDAMMLAAVEAAASAHTGIPPVLLGVTVLTSLDDDALSTQIGIGRTVSEHAELLAKRAIQCGVDGVVCSGHEVAHLRSLLGSEPVLVVPGIRQSTGEIQDQKRTMTGADAISKGATYIVVGRALTDTRDPEKALASLGL